MARGRADQGTADTAEELRRFDRGLRLWGGLGAGLLFGLWLAVRLYGGPSITLGSSLTAGLALVAALLTLLLGRRFWLLLLRFVPW